ncbi:MAG TPA: hypothetical protein ENJ18_11745 [Nannocystis exedens]|nr:hypothetical protein [Nannocystis exedens]
MKAAAKGARARSATNWTRLGVAYFVLATALLVWPIFPALGNRIEPRVLGLPFSLVYVLAVIVANTLVLAALYGARVIDTDAELDHGKEKEKEKGKDG